MKTKKREDGREKEEAYHASVVFVLTRKNLISNTWKTYGLVSVQHPTICPTLGIIG